MIECCLELLWFTSCGILRGEHGQGLRYLWAVKCSEVLVAISDRSADSPFAFDTLANGDVIARAD